MTELPEKKTNQRHTHYEIDEHKMKNTDGRKNHSNGESSSVERQRRSKRESFSVERKRRSKRESSAVEHKYGSKRESSSVDRRRPNSHDYKDSRKCKDVETRNKPGDGRDVITNKEHRKRRGVDEESSIECTRVSSRVELKKQNRREENLSSVERDRFDSETDEHKRQKRKNAEHSPDRERSNEYKSNEKRHKMRDEDDDDSDAFTRCARVKRHMDDRKYRHHKKDAESSVERDEKVSDADRHKLRKRRETDSFSEHNTKQRSDSESNRKRRSEEDIPLCVQYGERIVERNKRRKRNDSESSSERDRIEHSNGERNRKQRSVDRSRYNDLTVNERKRHNWKETAHRTECKSADVDTDKRKRKQKDVVSSAERDQFNDSSDSDRCQKRRVVNDKEPVEQSRIDNLINERKHHSRKKVDSSTKRYDEGKRHTRVNAITSSSVEPDHRDSTSDSERRHKRREVESSDRHKRSPSERKRRRSPSIEISLIERVRQTSPALKKTCSPSNEVEARLLKRIHRSETPLIPSLKEKNVQNQALQAIYSNNITEGKKEEKAATRSDKLNESSVRDVVSEDQKVNVSNKPTEFNAINVVNEVQKTSILSKPTDELNASELVNEVIKKSSVSSKPIESTANDLVNEVVKKTATAVEKDHGRTLASLRRLLTTSLRNRHSSSSSSDSSRKNRSKFSSTSSSSSDTSRR